MSTWLLVALLAVTHASVGHAALDEAATRNNLTTLP